MGERPGHNPIEQNNFPWVNGREIYTYPETNQISEWFTHFQPVYDELMAIRKEIPDFCFMLNGGGALELLAKSILQKDVFPRDVNTRDVDLYIPILPTDSYVLIRERLAAIEGFEWITDGIEDYPEPSDAGEWSRALGQAVYKGIDIDFVAEGGFNENGIREPYMRVEMINGIPHVNNWGRIDQGYLISVGGRIWNSVGPLTIDEKIRHTYKAIHDRRLIGYNENSSPTEEDDLRRGLDMINRLIILHNFEGIHYPDEYYNDLARALTEPPGDNNKFDVLYNPPPAISLKEWLAIWAPSKLRPNSDTF